MDKTNAVYQNFQILGVAAYILSMNFLADLLDQLLQS